MRAFLEHIGLVDAHAGNQRLLVADRHDEPDAEFQPH